MREAIVTAPSGPPFTVCRTDTNRVRLARQFGPGRNAFFMFPPAEAVAVARAILSILESKSTECTSVALPQGPPLVIMRQRGGLRLSRHFQAGESWMSCTESVACDIATALADVANG